VKFVKSVTGCFIKNVRNKFVYCSDTMQSSTFYSGWYINLPLSLKLFEILSEVFIKDVTV